MTTVKKFTAINSAGKKVVMNGGQKLPTGYQVMGRTGKFVTPAAKIIGGGETVGTNDGTSPFDQAAFITQLVNTLYPKTNTAPADFADQSTWEKGVGADQLSTLQSDYAPQFGQQNEQLRQSQAGATGNLLSDYYNRGLGQSGALLGAQNQLGYQQGLDTAALGSTQNQTLAQQKAAAYQNAFSGYLNKFNANK